MVISGSHRLVFRTQYCTGIRSFVVLTIDVLWTFAPLGCTEVHAESTPVDKFNSPDCLCWAAQGQCRSNAGFMLDSCAGSCARNDAFERHLATGANADCEVRFRSCAQDLEKQSKIAKESEQGNARVEEVRARCAKNIAEREDNLAKANARIVELEKRLSERSQGCTSIPKFETHIKMLEEQLAHYKAKYGESYSEPSVSHLETTSWRDTMTKYESEHPVVASEQLQKDSIMTTQRLEESQAEVEKRISNFEAKLRESAHANKAAVATLKQLNDISSREIFGALKSLEDAIAQRDNLNTNGKIAPLVQGFGRDSVRNPDITTNNNKEAHADARNTSLDAQLNPSHKAFDGTEIVSGDRPSLPHTARGPADTIDPIATNAKQQPPELGNQTWLHAFRQCVNSTSIWVQALYSNHVRPAAGLISSSMSGRLQQLHNVSGPSLTWVGLQMQQTSQMITSQFAKSKRRSSMRQFILAFSATVCVILMIVLLRKALIPLIRKTLRILLWPMNLLGTCCCGGLIRRMQERRSNGDAKIVRADLGHASAFYFDKEKGKWRERGKEHLEEADVPLAPPPTGPTACKEESPPKKEATALDALMAPPTNPYRLRPSQARLATSVPSPPTVAFGAFACPSPSVNQPSAARPTSAEPLPDQPLESEA